MENHNLLCLNREEGHAEAGKITRFIHGKSTVVFQGLFCLCVARVLQSAVPMIPFPCSVDVHQNCKGRTRGAVLQAGVGLEVELHYQQGSG